MNREVEIKSDTCPRCKGKRITRRPQRGTSKLAYDLKFTAGGIRRQVIRCTAARHRCEDCELLFLPEAVQEAGQAPHGLKSWAMYQHVVHRISLQHLESHVRGLLRPACRLHGTHMIKALMARRYRAT